MTQNVTVYDPFSSYFQQYTVDRTESYGQDSFNMCRFKNFVVLYSRVGAGAGAY
jgi:hypothetical protein